VSLWVVARVIGTGQTAINTSDISTTPHTWIHKILKTIHTQYMINTCTQCTNCTCKLCPGIIFIQRDYSWWIIKIFKQFSNFVDIVSEYCNICLVIHVLRSCLGKEQHPPDVEAVHVMS
jgi:predicted aldo/keto reductase-like oxidoreductase